MTGSAPVRGTILAARRSADHPLNRMKTLRRLSPVLLPLALSVLAGCGTQSAITRTRKYEGLGDFKHAYETIDDARRAQLANGGAVDDELAAEHERIRRAYLLDRARARIFQEREDEALQDLELLAKAAPDYPRLHELRARALDKKAARIVAQADQKLAQREFAAAMELYLASERVVPEFPAAHEGIEKVREELARLTARAQQQFLEAVRKVPEFRFVEVQWHAANVIHNEPNRSDAEALEQKAKGMNAQSIFEQAMECERQDKFGAALVLFKSARALDPKFTGVEAEIVKMERELEALGLIEQAQLAMRNHAFDNARELLGQAFEKSTLSRGTISELMIETRKLEGELHYQEARDLEIMGRKAEALAAFETLSKDWPDGLSDEKARISGLRVDIEGASTEWAAAEAAEAAGDLPAALEHYLGARRFYAKWRDCDAQIERLRAAIAAKAKDAERQQPNQPQAPNGG